MKICEKTLALATVVLSLPLLVGAQNTQSPESAAGAENTTINSGQSEAARMVPASALLSRSLDARKDHPGSAVEAKLTQRVRLSDGTELPSGSMLMGSVVQDDMQQQAVSKLALRFDQVRLKDGKVIRIRAMIVSILRPTYDDTYASDLPNEWTNRTLEIDQIDVVPGVDLHSKIASKDSGVFVSTKKDDVRLDRGSDVQLAVAPGSGSGNKAS